MMSLYVNGKIFGLDFSFPLRHGLPWVHVRMSRDGNHVDVVGVMNTAIRTSVLGFNTANALGIKNPRSGGMKGTLQTPSKKKLTYYVHMVMVHASNAGGQTVKFPMMVGFAKKVNGAFFGMDWSMKFCLAVDRRRVYLLHD